MKKYFFIVLLSVCAIQAKSQRERTNEVKLNIFNTLTISSAEVGYERYLDDHQSMGLKMVFNDRFSYYAPFSSKKKFNTTSIALNYTYYLGDADNNRGSGFSITPFVKGRFGNYKEEKSTGTEKTNMDSFILGIGGGYKWVLGNAFTIQPFFNIGRNFSETVNDKFMPLEPNAGVDIGYRF